MLFYKPWRRRIDRKRIGEAHFEPLSQSPTADAPNEEEQQDGTTVEADQPKVFNVRVEPAGTSDAARPVYH